jgi:hypothetical protein
LKAVSNNEVEIKNCECHFSLVYVLLIYLSFILVIFHPKGKKGKGHPITGHQRPRGGVEV